MNIGILEGLLACSGGQVTARRRDSSHSDDEQRDDPSYTGRMLGRSHKTAPAPQSAVEASAGSELADPARLRTEHLQEWRDAARRVMRTYHAWCAASRSNKAERYRSFLDALRREEMAARQVERDATSVRPA